LKLVLAAVAAVGMASVVATVVVGGRMREDTVVPNPYEAGIRWDQEHAHHASTSTSTSTTTACNATTGPCTHVIDSLAVTFDLSPRPLRTMADLDLCVQVREAGAPVSDGAVEVSFAMPGMFMGEKRAVLAPAGPGRYAGKGVLVRCASGRKDYTAEVVLRRPGRPPARASFDLRVTE
jgi:hypothetical protein